MSLLFSGGVGNVIVNISLQVQWQLLSALDIKTSPGASGRIWVNLGHRKNLQQECCCKFISELSWWMKEEQLHLYRLILWGCNVCQMAFLQQGKDPSYVHSTPHRCVAVHRHAPCHFSLARYHFHIFLWQKQISEGGPRWARNRQCI